MPREAGCECCKKCSRIDTAITEVNTNSWKVVDDGQCTGNEEIYGKQEDVGQNASICFYEVVSVA